MPSRPRILLLDIETAPNRGYFWGLFKQDISHHQVETSSYVLCWSAKWYDDKGVQFQSVQHQSAKKMLKPIHALLDEADVVVHYNGQKFDVPTLNKELVIHGFGPPSPYKQIDLLHVVREVFRFESNKLDAVLQALKLGQKVEHRGFKLWIGCMAGDAGCWAEMTKYNKYDVIALQLLYDIVRPWIHNHPNLALYHDGRPVCPVCQSTHVQRRGKEIARSRWYYRYQCRVPSCGKWFPGELVDPKRKGKK